MSAAVRPQPGATYRDDLLSGAGAATIGRWVDTQGRPVSCFIEAGDGTATTIALQGSFNAVDVHGMSVVANIVEDTPVLQNTAITKATDVVYPFLRYNMSAIGSGNIGAAFMTIIP